VSKALLGKLLGARNETLFIFFFGGQDWNDILFGVGFIALETGISVPISRKGIAEL